MHRAPETLVAIALLALALVAAPAGARESDRQQPATIEADRAEIDQASGESRYFGDVVFVQGSLRITGAELSMTAPDGVVRHAEAHGTPEGEPARIRQQTDTGQVVRAHARTIDYDAEQGLVTLVGNAELLRDGEHFAAGRIRYWPDARRVEGGRGDDGGRVRIRIEPETVENGAAEGQTPDGQAPDGQASGSGG